MPIPPITVVVANGRNITVQPTRAFFGQGNGANETIIWQGVGSRVTIEEVSFPQEKNSGAVPVSGLGPGPQPGQWQATWDATVKGVFRYSILVAQDGKRLEPPVDPEVENDPKPPPDEDDDDQGED